MSKLLNRLKKTTLFAAHGAPTVAPSTYEPSIPRVRLGIAGVAMTVITIAVSVILPAQMDSASREPRMLVASKATAPASMGVAILTRIDVVSTREPGSSTAPARIGEGEPQPGRPGNTTSPAVVRVSATGRVD
jgi:hypothetical protein